MDAKVLADAPRDNARVVTTLGLEYAGGAVVPGRLLGLRDGRGRLEADAGTCGAVQVSYPLAAALLKHEDLDARAHRK
jgi:hypothetical protein